LKKRYNLDQMTSKGGCGVLIENAMFIIKGRIPSRPMYCTRIQGVAITTPSHPNSQIVAMKLPSFTSVLMIAAVALGCGSQRRATDDAPTFAPIPNGDEGAYMVTEGSYQGIYFRPAIETGLYS
jgi:hypothetical protein